VAVVTGSGVDYGGRDGQWGGYSAGRGVAAVTGSGVDYAQNQ